MTDPDINPIGFLQEKCQKHSFGFPRYEEFSSSGPDHAREFKVKCKFQDFEVFGHARQKKQAKSEAAKAMIILLKSKSFFESQNIRRETCNDDYNETDSKNPISVINEYCQKKSLPPPQFIITSAGPGEFVCQCSLINNKTYGQGSNKKSAKTEAALQMCKAFQLKCSSPLEQQVIQKQHVEEISQLHINNPVSILQEIYMKQFNKLPEYTELTPENNIFVFKCTVESVTSEGRGMSKKIAKAEAAKNVLSKLPFYIENSEIGKIHDFVSKSSAVSSNNGLLEDFNIEDSDEEGAGNREENASKAVNDDLNVKLESLTLKSEDELKDTSDIKLKNSIKAQDIGEESS